MTLIALETTKKLETERQLETRRNTRYNREYRAYHRSLQFFTTLLQSEGPWTTSGDISQFEL